MSEIENILRIIISNLQSIGLIGGFFLVLLESIFPFLPLALFIGFNVIAFGKIAGFLISYVATITGCILSFILFRYVIKNLNLPKIKDKTQQKILNIMKKITNIDFAILATIIAVPFMPAFLINIAAGLSKINFKKYLTALLIGKLSIIFFWGYIGKSFIDSIKEPIILIKVVVLLTITFIISLIIKKIIKLEE